MTFWKVVLAVLAAEAILWAAKAVSMLALMGLLAR